MQRSSTFNSVLYLSYDGLTDPLGQSQILPYLSGLSTRGYNISIISFEKPERYQSVEPSVRKLCEESGIKWYPQKYHKKPPVISTLFDLFVLSRVARRLISEESIKVVHCRSYLTALIGLQLKRTKGVRLIFDMRGFWADERIEGGIWSLRNPLYRMIYRFFKRKERELVREADNTIVLTEAARQEVLSWQMTDRITVIPCCVDLKLFDPSGFNATDRLELRASLGIGANNFVLLYLGSLGTWYLVDEMMLFFKNLKLQRPDAKFLLLTPDNLGNSDADVITRTVPRKQVPRYIAIADASICYILPSYSKKGSSATKMAEVLAMNTPIVSNAGWGDVEFLKDRVNDLIINQDVSAVPDGLLNHARNDRQTTFFYDFFSLEKGVMSYESVYRSLVSAS